jgi:F0F1-type ATP synthase membrane subunit a
MEQLWFTALLNRLFGKAVLALLEAVGVHPKHPLTPISNSFSMEVLVVLLLLCLFLAVRLRLSVDQPNGLQHIMEWIEGFFGNMGSEIIGHDYYKYHAYIVTLACSFSPAI